MLIAHLCNHRALGRLGKKRVELSDLVASGEDLVKEPGDEHLDHAHLLALSPLNAGKEEGDEEEDIGEVLGEPGGKDGEDDDGDYGGEGEDGGDEDLMPDEI